MPELPDLQVFSKNLTTLLKNKKVQELRVPRAKKLNVTVKALNKALVGCKVKEIERIGKELYFHFTGDQVLALHLMLRGKLHFFKNEHEEKFPIIEILFTDNSGLVMTDFQGQATPTLNPPAHDGVDALSKEMNLKFFRELLSGSKAAIKKLLLDQHLIRGIGNAYADEILWEARVSPFSVSSKIPREKVTALHKAIARVMKDAQKQIIRRDPKIISGEIRDFLKIHNSKKELSPTGARILIDTGGGRKTYYTDEQILYS
jgi:formamidopyrimidine-DNA glycosylase